MEIDHHEARREKIQRELRRLRVPCAGCTRVENACDMSSVISAQVQCQDPPGDLEPGTYIFLTSVISGCENRLEGTRLASLAS